MGFALGHALDEEFSCQVSKLQRFVKHGPSLGRFVERLLIDTLRKYCPKKYSISSGFYYSQNPTVTEQSSSQLDVFFYDEINYPVLFDCSEFVVVPPKSIRGVIEVKSTINKTAINQLLKQSDSPNAVELPAEVKFNLIGVKSDLKADFVYEYIKEYYAQENSVVRPLGIVYCLEWHEIIIFDYRNNKYQMLLLNNFELGISSFFNQILYDIYGKEVYLSAANTIGPSFFIPIKSCVLRAIEYMSESREK